jgi:hypothetical protein
MAADVNDVGLDRGVPVLEVILIGMPEVVIVDTVAVADVGALSSEMETVWLDFRVMYAVDRIVDVCVISTIEVTGEYR